MKIMIIMVLTILLLGSIGGCSVVHSSQTLDIKAKKSLVSKEKEEVWTHFAQ